MVRFRRLDLNLLVALDAFLMERNVTRAAERLRISQSAASGALARLREYFGDELLIQVGRKMVLTERARLLEDAVQSVLRQIDSTVVRRPVFDMETQKRTIRIVASDYVEIVYLSSLISRLSNEAPGLKLFIEPPDEDPVARLTRGDVDLLIMPEIYLSDKHPSERLFSDDYVVVVWSRNQRYGDEITEDEFFNAFHVAANFPADRLPFDDIHFHGYGRTRKVMLKTHSFFSIPSHVIETDRIGLMPRRLASSMVSMMSLRILACPIAISKLEERVQWSCWSEGDPCLEWIRRKLVASGLQ
ncbi:LysR family transcriptional regulator [Rhizobium alvei]|uniref:LysR family transcriptional regulator n=1 Tax=Rhizobium alvei TaxID=1132659 RepID=A0ABT8YR03_9HYPH|nr:LysR family transcriptional regulator [Rhizobium alvei]MDO6966140.1 LysR family transcriptional regulator [Rhizobium alvei]